EEDSARHSDHEEPPVPQPWEHGPLLPIRVVLREFVARGLPPAGQPVEITSDTLWQFIVAELPAETLRDVATPLRTLLRTARGLLLLEGLAEGPEAAQHRVQVKAAIEQFVTVFPNALAGWHVCRHPTEPQGMAPYYQPPGHAPGPQPPGLREPSRPGQPGGH